MSEQKEKSVNQVTLSGILSEVIVRKTAGGDPVANASLEVIDSWDGERPRRQFLRLVCWRGLATKAAALPKAAKVRITGRLETASWQDKETGAKKYRVQIVAHSLAEISDLGEVPPAEPSKEKTANVAPLRNRSARNSRGIGGIETASAILERPETFTPGLERPVSASDPITDADVGF